MPEPKRKAPSKPSRPRATTSAARSPRSCATATTSSARRASSCSSTTAPISKTTANERTAREGQKSLKQILVHGPLARARRQAHQRATSRRAGPLRRTGQQHAADHQPARPAAPRHAKKSLKECIRRINEIKLGTIAACGDVSRNVMCCPAPHTAIRSTREMQDLADTLAAHFKPRTDRLLRNLAPRRRNRRRNARRSDGVISAMLPWVPLACQCKCRRSNGQAHLHLDTSRRPPCRRSRRADLRQDVSAAQVQDRHRPARRQLRRSVCQRPRPHGDRRRRHRSSATTCWSAAAWASRPPTRKRFRPSPSGCASSARAGDRRRHGDRQGAARLRQPRRPQARPHEVPDRQLGLERFKAKVEEYYGEPLADATRPTCTASTTTWAGTSKATAAGSTA